MSAVPSELRGLFDLVVEAVLRDLEREAAERAEAEREHAGAPREPRA